MTLPTLFVAGAMKAGTTSLHRYLAQHPDFFVPDHEEPSWFSFTGTRPSFTSPGRLPPTINASAVVDRTAYEGLYRTARPDQTLVDVSPTYLYVPAASERIAALVPDARAVVILRHPVDRAYSSFMHAVRERREPISDFAAALAAESDRIAANCGFLWRYLDMGWYHQQVRRLYDRLGAERVLVVLTEDLAAHPQVTCARIVAFAGRDPSFPFDVGVRHNVSGVPRSRWVHAALSGGRLQRTVARHVARAIGKDRLVDLRSRLEARNLRRQPLDPALRDELTEHFREDIVALSTLIRRDLGHWLPRASDQDQL